MSGKNDNLLPNFKPFVPQESINMVVKTLQTSWIGGDGPRVKEFENRIAKLIKNKNVAAVNSGTSALQLALRLAKVKGGEVISTPMTCFATNAAIVNEGGIPVWADINPATGNINPKEITRLITKKTRAVMVVHWGGSPAELDSINKIAAVYKLPVIEDAAQALGSEYNGKPIGSHSDFVALSFQAIKVLNTADGGLLATKKGSDIKRGRILRWYGIDRENRKWDKSYIFWDYPISEVGYKMQMTDVAASIGLGQLPYLKKHIEHRRRLAKLYEQALSKNKDLSAQKILPNAKSNYWMFTIICSNKNIKLNLCKALNNVGVKAEEAHRRNDTYPVFAKYKKGELPGVTFFNNNHLIIPVGHWVSLKKAQEIAEILASL